MTYLPGAGKAIAAVLIAVFMAGCSSTAKKDEEEAQRRADELARQEQAQMDQARQQQQILEQAVAAYGNVFYFDFDSSALRPESREALDAHVELLKTNDRTVRLEGHTDERGTREYNMALGERRANAVRDYLVVNGIDSYRIETVSYGEERPVAYGSGESSWSQNRRVELK
jgi:peptidoglycan-associated lipoprotein